MKQRRQSGYTLIEVMVAAALGVLLLGIVVTIYLGSKSTFRAAEGLARSQETTRFALHFLKRDIRMSGYQGCSAGVSRRNLMDERQDTFPLSEDNAVFGWEFANTDIGENYDLNYTELDAQFTQADLNAARTGNTEGGNSWSGSYILGTSGANSARNLPAQVAALSPLRGSDIISVTIAEPINDLRVSIQANQGLPTLETTDFEGTPIASNVETGTVVKIGDCSTVDTFQNEAGSGDQQLSAFPGGSQPSNLLTGAFRWQKKWDKDATIFRSTTKIYFVGTGAGGKPSLYAYDTSCGLGGACASVSELIEGVENMQILYGEDTLPPTQLDGVVDVYNSADDVGDFRNVLTVKIGLLVRSPDVALDQANAPTFDLLDQISITPPDDKRQRFVNNTTVRLHNRGL